MPALTLRNSMPQIMYHWGVFFASSQLKESAAETVLADGVKPSGSQPAGGFFSISAARVLTTR